MDRTVTVSELHTYLSEALPRLTNGAQYPTTYIPEGILGLPITRLE